MKYSVAVEFLNAVQQLLDQIEYVECLGTTDRINSYMAAVAAVRDRVPGFALDTADLIDQPTVPLPDPPALPILGDGIPVVPVVGNGEPDRTERYLEFRRVWHYMAELGKCDAPGGVEYQRVLREWKKAGRPVMTAAFILEAANRPPSPQGEIR